MLNNGNAMTLMIDPDLSTQPHAIALPPTHPEEGVPYLVIFSDLSCVVHPLPNLGIVSIGRGVEAAIRLHGNGVSRRHARLLLSDLDCWLHDEESQNGTFVNGERLGAPRNLIAGDLLQIGDQTLIFHRAPLTPGRQIGDSVHLRQRLCEELDRCSRYQRPLSLLCVRYEQSAPGGAREQVAQLFRAQLREMDQAAWDDSGRVLLLLPEVSPADVERSAAELLQQLRAGGLSAAVGIATCPIDGNDADALIAGARAAAAAAQIGQALPAAQTAVRHRIGDCNLVLAEPTMIHAYERIRRCATTGLSLLIYGETGVGKEVAAMAAHAWSTRATGPFVALNCAALPESLAESELFGYQRGAFTGALNDKNGLLDAASGGTLFLDEIGELSLAVQAKLLRAIDTRRVQRVGSAQERPVDLRVVCATNRDLRAEVAAGRFRQDLYYRLRGAEILLPPLRDRRRELPLLATALLEDACARARRDKLAISTAAMQQLLRHRWPGNVRELRSVMDYVAAMVEEPVLLPWHLVDHLSPAPAGAAQSPGASGEARRFRPLEEEVQELECQRITEALVATGYVQTRAAELLGVPDKTFRTKVKQYKISLRTASGPRGG